VAIQLVLDARNFGTLPLQATLPGIELELSVV
jgi:hypothetical protein